MDILFGSSSGSYFEIIVKICIGNISCREHKEVSE
jgi:hypothetical protein